jgi:hypothetical protein
VSATDFSDLVPQRNAATHARHRREVFWQITLPLILGGLGFTALCVLTGIAGLGGGGVSLWRDVSVIWLIVPGLALGLIPLAALGGLVYGVSRLLAVLPGFSLKAQEIFATISAKASQFSDALAKPLIRLRGLLAGLESLNKKTE